MATMIESVMASAPPSPPTSTAEPPAEAAPPPTQTSTQTPPTPGDPHAAFTGLDPDTLRVLQAKGWHGDPAKLAKGYVELEKGQGSMVRVPGPDAKPEERTAFWSKLGVPAKPEEYQLKTPPAEDGWDPALEAKAREVFHKHNLTPEAAQAVIDLHVGMVEGGLKALEDQAKETQATLRGEWGARYDENLGHFKVGLEAVFSPEVIQALGRTPMGNHPDFVRQLARLGEEMVSAGLAKPAPGGGIDPNEVQTRISAVMNDKAHPYWVKHHPEHQRAVEEMLALHEAATPLSDRTPPRRWR